MSATRSPTHQANTAQPDSGGDFGVRVRRTNGRTHTRSYGKTVGRIVFIGHPAPFALCATVVCCGLFSLMTPSTIQAGSGGVVTLPAGNARPKNGLRLNIDTRWIDANGYRPVRIEAINWPPGPTIADRTIRVEMSPQSWRWGYNTPAVVYYIEMPEKTALATTIVSVPQSGRWGGIDVEVYEDGGKLDDLSTTVGLPSRNPGNWTGSEATPAILIIDADAPSPDARQGLIQQQRFGRRKDMGGETLNSLPDIRYLAAYFPNSNAFGNPNALRADTETTDADTLHILDGLPKVEMLPPSELPTKWIDFTCFDFVFIPFSDLTRLAGDHPDRWQAIRDWLATGPTLCVYDMPLDSEHLADLEDLLRIPPVSEPGNGSSGFRGWSIPGRETADDAIRGLEGAYKRTGTPPWKIARTDKARAKKAMPDQTPFVSRSVDLGRVVALQTDEPFSPGQYGISWLLNDIGMLNWAWYGRHGMSLHRENSNYWNLMIPGVGRAPVNSYLVLISLFVVVIGPVNYYLLRRKKRLYLLLVTVPVGAGLVTVTLMNYALISDGLGMRVRVRSFAAIDQRAGRAVSWSRQTYYAGLAPSRGLSFPSDAAIYPIDQAPTSRRYRGRAERWLAWDDEQNLFAGYLSSRTMTQFMVVGSHPSDRGLRVVAADGDGAAPNVANDLDADIAKVLICDASGKCYWAEEIEAGEQFRPQPIDPAEALRHLRIAVNDNRPAFPIGYDSRYYRNAFGVRRRYWTDVDQHLPPPKFEDGILERSIHRTLYSGARNMKPRSFIAITETSAEVPLGYDSLREEASFHVIYGRW